MRQEADPTRVLPLRGRFKASLCREVKKLGYKRD
jgi:hypothetical protein